MRAVKILLLAGSAFTCVAAAEEQLDIEVYNVPQGWEVETVPVPEATPEKDIEIYLPESIDIQSDKAEAAEDGTIINRKLARWKDPFTLPKSRVKCAKWAKPWPGAKICIGHAYQWQWMYCEARLQVTGPTIPGITATVNECLQTGAAVAAVAGIAGAAASSGGAALPSAKAAFTATFSACVAAKTDQVIGVHISQNCGWGDWE